MKKSTVELSKLMQLFSDEIPTSQAFAKSTMMEISLRLLELHQGMHEAINAPKGVVPESCESNYDQNYYIKVHSKERGCNGKANLGRSYKKQADKFSKKHGKQYGVYSCHHCGGNHLTTKLANSHLYEPLLYLTGNEND